MCVKLFLLLHEQCSMAETHIVPGLQQLLSDKGSQVSWYAKEALKLNR
jgi:hypothetical protein